MRRCSAVLVHLAVFFGTVALTAVIPLLPILLDSLFGEQDITLLQLSRWTGLAVAATPLTAAITWPVWRQAARDGHGRALLEILLVVAGVLLAGLARVHVPEQLLTLMVGLGCVGLLPLVGLMLFPPSHAPNRPGAVSWMRLAIGLALVAGPALGGAIAHRYGLRPAFVAAGCLSVVSALLLAVGIDHPLLVTDPPAAPGAPAGTARTVGTLGAVVLVSGALASGTTLLPLFLLDGIEVPYARVAAWSGLAIGAMGLSSLISTSCTYLIGDVVPIKPYLLLGSFVAAGFAWLMSQAQQVQDFIGWSIAFAGATAMLGALLTVGVARQVGLHHRSTLAETLVEAELWGFAAGPLAVGYLNDGRPAALFVLAAILILATVPLVAAMTFKPPMPDSPPLPDDP